MSGVTTVLLADDHTLVREMLRERLQAEPDMSVVADVADADAAVSEAVRGQPDVVVLDIDMPGLHCFEAARTIKARSPKTRVLFLSAFTNDRYIEQAIAVQAAGYLTKTESTEVMVRAVRSVAAGGTYYSPEIQMRIVIDDHRAYLARGRRTEASTLTPREIEVLRYIAKGMSKKEMAATMHLSVRTVEVHTQRLMRRLNLHDRVELARFAIREGLVEP
ncbi:MAG: response regulator transcription factor [Phycisphaerae bacterium]|nr:response regulator transcription factor [Phycisphaerae bacterium]